MFCEDTRHSRTLLAHYGIHAQTRSLPAFAEGERSNLVLDALLNGDDVALVTDAGSPAISDPGELLVAKAVAASISVVPIPGSQRAHLRALCFRGYPREGFTSSAFFRANAAIE